MEHLQINIALFLYNTRFRHLVCIITCVFIMLPNLSSQDVKKGGGEQLLASVFYILYSHPSALKRLHLNFLSCYDMNNLIYSDNYASHWRADLK